MLELGKFSIDCHARVGEFALQCAERLYCLGTECRPIYEIWKNAGREAEIFQSRPELAAALRAQLEPSDIVLLKGSRFWELWKIVEEI